MHNKANPLEARDQLLEGACCRAKGDQRNVVHVGGRDKATTVQPRCRLSLAGISRAWGVCVCERPRTWRQVRGPLGALLLTLERLSWTAQGPFTWQDDRGSAVDLTSMSPALVRTKVRGTHYRLLERRLARRLAALDDDGTGATPQTCGPGPA